MRTAFITAMIAAVVLAGPVMAADTVEATPKRGGTLTYMIPSDAPPSLDGLRETTYATIHTAAPFYSVLIRINPENPSSTTDFVCDLCTAMPQPADAAACPRIYRPVCALNPAGVRMTYANSCVARAARQERVHRNAGAGQILRPDDGFGFERGFGRSIR